MSVVAVGVKGIVAFKEHVMRTHEVTGVKPYLDPVLGIVNKSIVHVVVRNHRPGARGASHYDLVGPDRNAVLDKHL